MQTSVPLYKLQIVDAEGERVATFHGGGTIERWLVLEVSRAAAAKVGWWRSRVAVQAAVTAAIGEVIDGMKAEVTEGLSRA